MKNINGCWQLAAILSVFVMLTIPGVAQAKAGHATLEFDPNSPAVKKRMAEADRIFHQQVQVYIDWTNAPLADGSPDLTVLRRFIDQRISSGMSAAGMLRTYHSQYLANPHDPLALFAMGYTAFKLGTTVGAWHKGATMDDAFDIYDSISKKQVNMPHTYEAARTVFLAQSIIRNFTPAIEFGKRLLQHYPNDPDVKFALTTNLAASSSAADQQLAAKYVDEIAKAHPDDPRIYLLKEMLVEPQVNKQHDLVKTQYCIDMFQKYLDSEPAGSSDASNMKEWIQHYEIAKKEWAAGHNQWPYVY